MLIHLVEVYDCVIDTVILGKKTSTIKFVINFIQTVLAVV